MQSGAQATKLDDKRIEHVRALRRAAIRRRQILVGSLLAVAIVVFVLALLLHFSPLFALIPVVLDVIVLALGVRASKQAREWEHKVAAAKRRAAKKSKASGAAAKGARNRGTGAGAAAASAAGEPDAQTATDAMSAQDIQAALERAKAEKIAALRARELERRAREAAARAQAQSVMPDDDEEDVVEETPSAGVSSAGVPAAQSAQSPATIAPRSQRRHETGETPKVARQQAAGGMRPATHKPVSAQSQTAATADGAAKPVAAKPAIKEKPAAEPEDFTNELERVSPSHALDAFELAANQDLISFSLGAPRHGKPVKAAEPQSLEIKSTKQVAHAEPVKAAPAADDKAKTSSDTKPAAVGSDKAGMTSRSDAKAAAEEQRSGRPVQGSSARAQRAARPAANAASKQTAPVTPSSIRPASVPKDDAVSRLVGDKKVEEAAARRAERKAAVAAHAPVAAPKETEESLGVNVDAVLARRRG
ncbi:hypothetical protein [Bifidobacterium callimiconis]|uniref:Uncharacterized protein n=1 Tax=Bifidobacterium callimiconis TaxID=2306973 RepID=A0A430FCA2_9BIFI|nr:hypothetical protein [Bifidobacterium callimiconis]MBT1177422.1 hypothetical protein [Bifidobacterium callimiconis]RSX50475.1 hypothetical protein D2E23_1498 [Bifidobacterium callimiconis]